MADVAKSPAASMDTSTGMFAPQVTGNLYAGEALSAVAPCYIKATDGKVYMSNGAAADAAAGFDGFTPRACSINEAVALFGVGARFRYGTALVPGSSLFISATAGGGVLGDAATVGGTVAVAKAINSTDIRVIRNG